jgi:3D (Asp-Asp-Asp) domain-containing protein
MEDQKEKVFRHHQRTSCACLLIFIAIVFTILFFVFSSNGAAKGETTIKEIKTEQMEIHYLPPKHYEVIDATITAYNTVPSQTDDSPCIAAGGYICDREDVVACPRHYPLGTRVEIAGKVYECMDRLAPKYDHRFDISMGMDIAAAKEWGVKKLSVKILN